MADTAAKAVAEVTGKDRGRDERQLAALDPKGRVGHFTGANSIPTAAARSARHVVVSGNLLTSEAVLDACIDTFQSDQSDQVRLADRLIASLCAAARAGGDSRGLLSAALLVVSRNVPPLSLRIDWSETPLDDLTALHARTQQGIYADWLDHVPTLEDPERAAPFAATEAAISRQ